MLAYQIVDFFCFETYSKKRYLITYEVDEFTPNSKTVIVTCNNCKVIKIEDLSTNTEINILTSFKTIQTNLGFKQEKEEYLIGNVYQNKILFFEKNEALKKL